MVGIFGGFGSDSTIFEAMAKRLSHRNLYGHVLINAQNISLGTGKTVHGANLFFEDPSGRLSIVLDGQFDNYRAIRDELEQGSIHFQSQNHAELFCHAYHVWGIEKALVKLEGSFALALFDAHQNCFYLARDSFGTKPLYCFQDNDNFYFASEIKAFWALENFQPKLNQEALALYLALGYVPPPLSIFAQVYKPGAGEFLRFAEGKWEIIAYYQIPMNTLATPVPYPEARQTLRELSEKALLAQSRHRVSPAILLSGGLDSVAVLALMKHLGIAPEHSLTVGFQFKGQDSDEKYNVDLAYAELAAKTYGTKHHSIKIDSKRIAESLPQMIYHLDEPIAEQSIIQVFYASAVAKSFGIAEFLTGSVVDEFFGGYGQSDRQLDYFFKLPRAFRQHLLAPIMNVLPALQELSPKILADEPSQRYLEWMRFYRSDEIAALLAMPSEEIEAKLSNVLNPILNRHEAKYFADRSAYLNASLWISEQSNIAHEKMSMSMGIEMLSPLQNRDLAAFAFRLPLEYKLKGNTLKHIFKDAVRDLVPKEILERPKHAFVPPLALWLRQQNRLRAVVEKYLSSDNLQAAGLCNPQIVLQMWEEHQSKKANHYRKLWGLVVLHIWYDNFIKESETQALDLDEILAACQIESL